MSGQTSDLFRAKRGTAVLATSIVQTLNESDPTFQERFLERLGRAYHEVRDNWQGDVIEELELLSWMREFLVGFSPTSGKTEPFLDGN